MSGRLRVTGQALARQLALAFLLGSLVTEATAEEPEDPDKKGRLTELTEEDLARAESGNPLPVNDDQWRYSIAFPMLWMPDINGKIRGGEDIDFDIPFSDIIDQLSFGMMFELYANRGPFGLTFRSMLLNTKDEEARSTQTCGLSFCFLFLCHWSVASGRVFVSAAH